MLDDMGYNIPNYPPLTEHKLYDFSRLIKSLDSMLITSPAKIPNDHS